jgi:hypothetical protein
VCETRPRCSKDASWGRANSPSRAWPEHVCCGARGSSPESRRGKGCGAVPAPGSLPGKRSEDPRAFDGSRRTNGHGPKRAARLDAQRMPVKVRRYVGGWHACISHQAPRKSVRMVRAGSIPTAEKHGLNVQDKRSFCDRRFSAARSRSVGGRGLERGCATSSSIRGVSC